MSLHPKTIEEDLQSLSEQELFQKEENRKIKRFLCIMGGLLTFFLFLSFTFVTYPVGHIIEGKLESQSPIAHVLHIDGISILFEQGTEEMLKTLYVEQQKVEFSVCLFGQVERKDTEQQDKLMYHITSLYTPKMYQQTFNHVVFEPCSKDTLILLHSHPYKSCLASDTDIDTLQKMKLENPNVLMVVMCEPNRFSVYSNGSKLSYK